jgi:hypothetical protein
MRARARGELQDAIGRKRADRQVVVAGPAEAAQVRAAADDFDEEPRPNSVSGVKMLVAGGSTASVVLSAALRTGSGARRPADVYPASVPSRAYCGS